MPRGNDAIPSWSGYNYQGKIALLCALEKINSVVNVDGYSLELEKEEDFIIRRGEAAQEIYQVKATLSQTSHTYYTSNAKGDSPSKKLLSCQARPNNISAVCYLVCAIDIADWTDGSNPYKGQIKLYCYGGKAVSLGAVSDHIKRELKRYCKVKGLPCLAAEIDSMYARLCIYLEEKVREMHETPYKKRQYSIPLQEFVEAITQTADLHEQMVTFHLREQVYQKLSKSLKKAVESHCSYCTKAPCRIDCPVHRLSEEFSSAPDLAEYIAVINPASTLKDLLDYVEHSNSDLIQNHIVYPFSLSESGENVKRQHNAILFFSKYAGSKNKRVLPTLLDLTPSTLYDPTILQKKLQQIKDNMRIQDSIAGNTLLAYGLPSSLPGALNRQQINSEWNKIKPDSVNDPYSGTEIVSAEDFLEEIKTP